MGLVDHEVAISCQAIREARSKQPRRQRKQLLLQYVDIYILLLYIQLLARTMVIKYIFAALLATTSVQGWSLGSRPQATKTSLQQQQHQNQNGWIAAVAAAAVTLATITTPVASATMIAPDSMAVGKSNS
jgi:hypothetical protein